MDSEHPYRPPVSDVGGLSSGISGDSPGLSPGALDALRKTRPWVLFMSVMILLACALLLLGAVGTLIVGSFGGAPGGGVGVITLGVVYLIMAALYLYPATRLFRFAAAIRKVRGADQAAAVEDALRQQLAFWRFMGIVSIAILIIYALFFLIVIVFGIATGVQNG